MARMNRCYALRISLIDDYIKITKVNAEHSNKHQEILLRLSFNNIVAAPDNKSTFHLKHWRKSQGIKSHKSSLSFD
ncbi:MAG: hypothetical protein WBF33_19210 [Candidatus Nitrosopolaris sp.]